MGVHGIKTEYRESFDFYHSCIEPRENDYSQKDTYLTDNVRSPRQVAVDYQCPLSLLVGSPHPFVNK